MRILVYSLNYKPELVGTGKYTSEMVDELLSYGHDVRVVTAKPFYPHWKIEESYKKNFYMVKDNIIYCPLWVPNKPGGMKRIFHLLSFALTSCFPVFRLISWRADLIWTVEPTLFCAPVALLYSKITRAKSWLHIQDFEIEASFALGIFKSKSLQNLVLFIERIFLNKFEFISTISKKMSYRLEQKINKKCKLKYFPNWVDVRHIYPIKKNKDDNFFAKKFNIKNEDIVLLYSGNFGRKQGLEIIIEAASRIENLINLNKKSPIANMSANFRNIIFFMCGDGEELDSLKKIASNLSNLKFIPFQSYSMLNELLNLADIHLITQKSQVDSLVLPSKLGGIFASGRPVIATAAQESDLANLVQGKGLCTPPEDLDKFIDAILELSLSDCLRENFGAAARKYAVEYLNKQTIIKSFEREFNDKGRE
ncbi:WcaI family glycosyltransferase [Polynucleobacter sp. CS-Odin-A6]|uniref:WcaI family glycosyltransferase n=1 Tax=Polynucleobacter sp. CS-Odin-A6 TaxID=2689106 RepID=UPI001C0C2CA8|nr:WcaI family glycosyltransferase [Polynucleobacter sp. CS-Odin-A6]MBU3621106.1 WcaI family glycosyltransferase [Polynucleobacter sp. CS-Odin-A6]